MENQPPEKIPAEIIENAAPETPLETVLETVNPEIAPEITTETNLNSNLKNENKNESENDTENTSQETVGNAPENAIGDAPRTSEENSGCESGKPAQTSPLDNNATVPPQPPQNPLLQKFLYAPLSFCDMKTLAIQTSPSVRQIPPTRLQEF